MDEAKIKAEEYVEQFSWNDPREEDARDAYIAGYEQGRADAWRWIPVRERLPEKSGNYLVIRHEYDDGSSLGYCADRKGWNLGYNENYRKYELFPLYWMELPTAPIQLPGDPK